MDALQAPVRGHLSVRRAEAVRAEAIVEDEIQTFAGWLGRLEVLPTLTALRSRGDAIVDGAAGRERGPLGVAERARRGARGGAGARGRQAAAARADRARARPRRRAPPRAAGAAARAVRPRRGGGGGGGRGRRGPPARTGDARSGSAPGAARWRWPRPASVAALLGGDVELVKITTAGDVDRARGDKSRWVGALEAALLAGEIDLAVHSAKDVPGELAAGTEIVATPRRARAVRRPSVRLTCARARGWGRARCAAARSCSPRGPTSRSSRSARQRRHAAGQARGGRGRRARAGRRRARPARPPRRGRRAAARRRVRARRRARA